MHLYACTSKREKYKTYPTSCDCLKYNFYVYFTNL